MARTTATEVKQIIETDLSDAIVNAYIAGATELVTQALGTDTTLSTALLEEIERWLTAHMISITRERQLKSGEAGGAKAVYFGMDGSGLDASTYGQMVKTLDSTGKMAALGGRKVTLYAVESFDE